MKEAPETRIGAPSSGRAGAQRGGPAFLPALLLPVPLHLPTQPDTASGHICGPWLPTQLSFTERTQFEKESSTVHGALLGKENFL